MMVQRTLVQWKCLISFFPCIDAPFLQKKISHFSQRRHFTVTDRTFSRKKCMQQAVVSSLSLPRVRTLSFCKSERQHGENPQVARVSKRHCKRPAHSCLLLMGCSARDAQCLLQMSETRWKLLCPGAVQQAHPSATLVCEVSLWIGKSQCQKGSSGFPNWSGLVVPDDSSVSKRLPYKAVPCHL